MGNIMKNGNAMTVKNSVVEKNRLYLFSTLALCEFGGNFINSLQGVLLTDFINFYHLESVSQGLAGTFQSVGGLIACLSILFLAGRVKKQYGLLFAGCCMVAGPVLIGLKPSFAIFLMCYTLMGIGYGSWGAFGTSMVSSLYNNDPKYTGITKAMFGLAGLIAPIVLRFFRGHLEWNQVAIVDGCLFGFVLMLYVIALLVTRKYNLIEEEKGQTLDLGYAKHFFAQRRNVLLLISIFAYQSFQSCLAAWMIRYSEFTLNSAQAGTLMLSTFWIGISVARLTLPRMKISPAKVLAYGCLITTGAMLIGIACRSIPIWFVCIAIAGFSSGASIPFTFHLCVKWNPGSLIPSTFISVTLSSGPMITAPITAAFASANLSSGLLVITAYALLSGASMIPVVIEERKPAKGI